MAWMGLICSLSCRNSGKIDSVVFNKCYFSIICFANWVWQESELLTYLYLTRFSTAKSEFQNRFETSGYMDCDGRLKAMLYFSYVCGYYPINNQVILYDGHGRNFDNRELGILQSHQIQDFILRGYRIVYRTRVLYN